MEKNVKKQMLKKIFLLAMLFPLFSCTRQQHDELLIAVSIPPQAWFVSQIAGDNAQTFVLAGAGQNPHNFEPTPRQLQSLMSAKAWILSGAEFEISLVPKVKALFSNLLIVDSTQGVNFRLSQEHENCEHESHDSYDSYDRHTWLGREPSKILASHILDTLTFFDDDNKDFYTQQYTGLVSSIDEEFDSLKILLAPLVGKTVFVYHPSFGYFLDEFGIHQEAVEIDGKEPAPGELFNLVNKIKEHKAAALFVQTQFPVNAAKLLAENTGIEIIFLDPLAENWLENIRIMGEALMRALH